MERIILDESFLFSRQLWDQDWIEAGCPEDQFPENTNYDNAIGTWWTNYAIGMTCFIGIFILTFQFHYCFCQSPFASLQDNTIQRRLYLILHLVFLGLTYTIAGVYHQIATGPIDGGESDNDNEISLIEKLFSRIPFCFLQFSMPGLINAFVPTVFGNNKKKLKKILVGLFFATCGIAMFILPIRIAQVATGGINAIVALLLAIFEIYIVKQHCVGRHQIQQEKESLQVAIPWFFAMVFTVGGLILQIAFSNSCGSKEAYMNCFEECIFDYRFNHNAIFHLLVNIGVIFTIYGGYNLPLFLLQQQETETPDATKGTNNDGAMVEDVASDYCSSSDQQK